MSVFPNPADPTDYARTLAFLGLIIRGAERDGCEIARSRPFYHDPRMKFILVDRSVECAPASARAGVATTNRDLYAKETSSCFPGPRACHADRVGLRAARFPA
jgi:hypothetical protein